jgi:hypothetical protein
MYLKIAIVFLLTCSLLGFYPQSIVSEELKIVDMPLPSQVEVFSKLYGVDSTVVNKVIQCESNGNHKAVGDGGLSRGIAQFQKPTFNNLAKLYSKEYNESLNYDSEFDQVKLLTWSIANGHGRNWTAYRALMNGGKYSFYSNQLKQHFTVYC